MSVVPQQGPQQDAEPFDFVGEAQRVIEAIEPKRGATMTVVCALHEAYQAGRAAALSASRIDPPVWTAQDWLTLDRIEQYLTTIGAITSDDAHWLVEHLTKLAKAASRIDPPVPSGICSAHQTPEPTCRLCFPPVPSPGGDTEARFIEQLGRWWKRLSDSPKSFHATVGAMLDAWDAQKAAAVVPSPSAPEEK